MIPAQFDYVRPASLHEALATLRDREGEAKVIAGGYSLLPLIKLRLAQPALLVDLRDIGGELDRIAVTDDELLIGASATHRRILESPIVAHYPMFTEAAAGIGDPQVRNWGTIGGSCAHADPAADWPPVLIASGASLVCRSATGVRTIPAAEFFVDTFETAIEPTEILTEIRVPRRRPGTGGAYRQLERRAGDFSTVGAAVRVRFGDDGRIADAGVGLTAVAPAPFAAREAEAALVGAEPSEETFRRAAAAAAAQSRPVSDSHGPAEYKRAMVAEMTLRAARAAVERALAS